MDNAERKETVHVFAPDVPTVNQDRSTGILFRSIALAVFPSLFYLIIFCLYTYPLFFYFSTHFFADQGDGLQNVWNLWWVNKAITQSHQLPWHTSFLHYPNGVSLLGSTLNPFNGFMGVVLLKALTLIQVHNFILLFSFVIGGVTTFWLAYYLTKSYWSSILAGFIFTFSNYHFAHAEGHLQMVSLEWIPLFILCWYVALTKPGIPVAVASAITLVAVILCDYYYFFYCVVMGGLMVAWYAVKEKDFLFFFKKEYLIPLGIFVGLLLITVGPLVLSLLFLNARDPLWGFHSPIRTSLDLLAPVIPGGHWYFAHLTEPFWARLTVNIHESSVHMGISVLFLLTYVWLKRGQCGVKSVRLWYCALLFFAIMSLGPVLHIWGREILYLRLPYGLLEGVFPPLKLSGCPVRMMVMVMLCSAIICATGVKILFQESSGKRCLVLFLMVLLLVEYFPKPLPASQPIVPPYVEVLKRLPHDGGIIDVVSRPTLALYFQTIHEKPVAFGYVARIPTSVRENEQTIRALVRKKEYGTLFCRYRFKYLVTNLEQGIPIDDLSIGVLYRDSNVAIFDLEPSSLCNNCI
jgi:hypothetical protein